MMRRPARKSPLPLMPCSRLRLAIPAWSGWCSIRSRPLAAFAAALAPALMAGATLVVKPSPKAPSAIYALCELSARVEWPAGVLNLLQGDTAAVEGLCAAAVDRLLYAGNPALGEQVGRIAAAAGTPFEMLGG